jgi:hypothetical protein
MMRKKSITVLLLIFLFHGLLFYYPINSEAIQPVYKEKLLFFTKNQPFSWNQIQIEYLKQKQEIFELEQFPRLQVIRIKATDLCLQTILSSYPQTLVMDDFIYKAQPIICQDSSSEKSNLDWNLDLIHVKELWEKGFTGKGIKIAVLDTGADSKHPALQGKIKDFAIFDKYGAITRQKDAYDTYFHGTHVAGIASGGSTKEPLGVAPGSNLSIGVVIPYGSGTFSQIIGGLEWILDPDGDPKTNDSPRAVNLSLGLAGFNKLWTPIFQTLLSKNILPVCSIGNEGDGISSSPGNTPNAFSVGAFDQKKKPAFFSSGSDQILWEDSIFQTDPYLKPDISAPGYAIRSSIPDNQYELLSGTSMASPHVAGAVAILAQAFPDASSYDLLNFLKSGAQDEGKKGPDTRFGQGSLNVYSSWKLLTEARRVYGKLNNYTSDYYLQIAETGLPVYVNSDQMFSAYLSPGSYHLEIRNKQKIIQSILFEISTKNLKLNITLPFIQSILWEGKVKDANGNPIPATIITHNNRFSANKEGFFSISEQTMEEIIIRSSGYKEEKIYLNDKTPLFLNITLKKVSILLVEGNSNYTAIKNPPRLARNYYFQALEQNHIQYAFQNVTNDPLKWQDISSFDTIIYFFESGSFTQEEGLLLSRFLDQGGKLLVSGRMVMFLENYEGLSFLGNHFGVSSKETISFPSISNMDNDSDFKNMQFALTGNGGANNQENCDILQRRESSINPIPFLKFNEIGKDKYAGVLATNGIYRGIFIPFGFEGIGSSQSRIELMKKMIDWLYQTGSMEIKMPSDAPFYVELRRDTGFYTSSLVESGTFIQKNLTPGHYQILVQGFGYESFETAQFIDNKDFCSLWIQPKKSPLQHVTIQLDQFNKSLSYLEVFFHKKSIYFKEYNSVDSYSIDLPQGDFTIVVRALLFETKFYQTKIKNEDQEIKILMKQNEKKILLVDDSVTGDYLLDQYTRIGDYFEKHLASTPFRYDSWKVAQKGKPQFLDMIPYHAVIYLAGLNVLSLESNSEKEQVGKYLDKGGKILVTGNYIHTILQNTDFLHQYFGIEVKSSNIREQSILGAPNSPFADLSFDISDSLSNNGIYVPFGSFELLNNSVQPLLLYYSGEIACTYYQGESFKSIYLPFGLENMLESTVRIDVLTRMIKLILAD